MRVSALGRDDLAAAIVLLDRSCPYDRAGDVADEKLFGPGPTTVPVAFGAWDPELVGVAAVAGNRIRILAVDPAARGRGIGAALLAACEGIARGDGHATLRTLDQAGNYLAPGVDARNTETIAWLERRGFVRAPDDRANVLIAVRDNPRVTMDRLASSIASARTKGYEVRRARPDESTLLDAVAAEFGGAWPFELARALAYTPAGAHVVTKDGAYCAFAAHDGNNRGLGWFGPTGTWPAHRGNRLGEAVLLACLIDVAVTHTHCEVAWIGPRPFYDKVAGVVEDRTFVLLVKAL